MLFIESQTSKQLIDGAARIQLLEGLQEKGLIPLIRSARLTCYELALMAPDRAQEMERVIATLTETEDNAPYVRGDLFCFEDFVLFLIFNKEGGHGGMRAGIIYGAETTEPLKKLEAFCRNISSMIETRGYGEGDGRQKSGKWELRELRLPVGFTRVAPRIEDNSPAAHEVIGSRGLQAAEALEDARTRNLLRHLSEAHADGHVAELLADSMDDAINSLANRLSSVGLLQREVLISCRKKGRALFRLPSTDALAVITAAHAVCHECGAAIADEKVEEFFAPTETASTLLNDDLWLTSRLLSVLRELGVPESEIAVGPTSADGEAHVLVNVCGERFLFVLIDGDLTAVHVRHALVPLTETESTHLVIIVTGKVQGEGRTRLREYARRRTHGGADAELLSIEGVDALAEELRRAFERVTHRALVKELYELDASLGFSAGYVVATRFRLMRKMPDALENLAQSAVSAVAGGLREI